MEEASASGGDGAPRPAGTSSGRPARAGREHALGVIEFGRVLELVARRATSDLGAERIRRLRPSSTPAAVRQGLDAAEEMLAFVREAEAWGPPRIPDLRSVLERLGVEGSVLDEEGLVGIARLLASSRAARRDLPTGDGDAPRLSALADRMVREPDLQERLERSFDDAGEVADGASKRLRRIRSDLRDARQGLTDLLRRFSRELRDRVRVPDASVTVRSGRYCIPVRREGRSEVGGIVHDESASGQTLFVEPPPAIEPMNRVKELQAEERREVQRILRELTDVVRPLEPGLSDSLEALAELDALFARARWARAVGGARPRMGTGDGRGEVRITDACHPLLLAAEEEAAVPFDLELSEEERVLLVSGPNAGGKTVLLKTVGLLSALAQSGVLPPVGPDTRLPLFTDFFAIIGDEQSIDASLSTFSAQVETLREILREADRGSLVLLDEVGSHTDPAEGAALASSVLLRLAGQAGLTLATTHLGALKALAGEDDRVVNASLQFDAGRLRPTYRLRRDRPGRSYAFEIAERLGLPDDVLEEARSRMEASGRRMEEVLAELEEKEERLSRLTGEAEEREARLERQQRELEERSEKLERREERVERAARERAEEYLLEARREVEEAVERLEREYAEAAGEAPDEAASEARSRVEEAVRESRESMPDVDPEPEPREPPDVEPGDPVRIRSLDREGRVKELRGDEVVVEAGGVRITLPATDLEALEAGEDGDRAPRAAPSPRAETRPHVEPKSEVHLRGLRVDEVESELLPYLDAAVVADLPRFRIVHGKGTGALREKVQQILSSDPRVARYRTAETGEGGRGVTVVEFE